MLKLILIAALPLTLFASDYWVFKGKKRDLSTYLDLTINKARVQVYTLREGVRLIDIPVSIRKDLRSIDLAKQLPKRSSIPKFRSAPDRRILDILDNVTIDSYKETLEWLVSFGKRSTPESRQGIMDKLDSYGYIAVEDYNIEAYKKGSVEPDKFIILEAHMDTVRNTMGADDNGSGTAALLEAARVLKDIPTKYSILFLVTEDEEKGLLGSKYKVKRLKEQNRLKDLIFVANMDMIAYRDVNRFDIETEPPFESLANWVVKQSLQYTTLEPNILLNAWGADHVPFLNENVPTVLTIEHWNNHNPCYHRSCDTLDLVDWDFAAQITKLNVAMVALKAVLL